MNELPQRARDKLREVGEQVAQHSATSFPDNMAERLVQLQAKRRQPKDTRLFTWAFAVAASLAIFYFAAVQSSQPLRFVVQASHEARPLPGKTGQWIASPSSLKFSDESQMTLGPATRGRVLSTTAHGAEIVIEQGHADLSITPRSGGRWSVVTGPYTVHVTGTRFSVDFDAAKQTLWVTLAEGHVRVSGCGLRNGRDVSKGETFTATCSTGKSPMPQPNTMATVPLAANPLRSKQPKPSKSAMSAPQREPKNRTKP